MEQIIIISHLLVALGIIGLIMMQQGKGADIGASFGAGGSQTLFGSVGSANLLTKLTAVLVATFFVTSFGLAMIADSRTAGQEDLGFELPVEAAMAPVDDTGPADELPAGDIPDVVMAPADDGDLPVPETGTGNDIDSNEDLPEG